MNHSITLFVNLFSQLNSFHEQNFTMSDKVFAQEGATSTTQHDPISLTFVLELEFYLAVRREAPEASDPFTYINGLKYLKAEFAKDSLDSTTINSPKVVPEDYKSWLITFDGSLHAPNHTDLVRAEPTLVPVPGTQWSLQPIELVSPVLNSHTLSGDRSGLVEVEQYLSVMNRYHTTPFFATSANSQTTDNSSPAPVLLPPVQMHTVFVDEACGFTSTLAPQTTPISP
jgi:hypothetical protein